jgi:hypothetical protein
MTARPWLRVATAVARCRMSVFFANTIRSGCQPCLPKLGVGTWTVTRLLCDSRQGRDDGIDR